MPLVRLYFVDTWWHWTCTSSAYNWLPDGQLCDYYVIEVVCAVFKPTSACHWTQSSLTLKQIDRCRYETDPVCDGKLVSFAFSCKILCLKESILWLARSVMYCPNARQTCLVQNTYTLVLRIASWHQTFFLGLWIFPRDTFCKVCGFQQAVYFLPSFLDRSWWRQCQREFVFLFQMNKIGSKILIITKIVTMAINQPWRNQTLQQL